MPQISASISLHLKERILDLANQRDRTFSTMVEMLLQQAVREIDRQRAKNTTKNKSNVQKEST